MIRTFCISGCILILAAALLLSGCTHAQVDSTPPLPTATWIHSAPSDPTKLLPTPTSRATVTIDPPVAEANVTQVQPDPTLHIVEDGDTLIGIAMQYDVPMAAIQLQNQRGSSTIVQAGETLEIPNQAPWEGASPFWILYEVPEGESLSTIGERYSVSVGRLQAVNSLSTSDPLRVGQLLVLPLESPVVAEAPEPTATPVPPPTTVLETITEPPMETAPFPTPLPAAPPPADIAAWPYETVRLINVVRAEHGLPPLAYNETLAQAAQAHANDCMQRGSCSHSGSDGSTIKERVRRVGYEGRSWAECWAQRKTPQGAVDIWMDEIPPNDPHRRTLLTTWFTEIGVGVAETTWGYYFIADFGVP